jgi:hypothetical protein
MQSSLPAGWLAFTGRELNPLDRYKRFQITFSFPFSGFILAQEGPSSISRTVMHRRTQTALVTHCHKRRWPPSFDHFVGAARQCDWQRETECFGCLEVDD